MNPGLVSRARKSPPPFGEVPLREWLFPLGVAALLMAIVWIPYSLGYSLQDGTHRFMGLVGTDAIDDNNVYLGLMRQSAEGRVLFTNNFTPEPNPPALFNFLYLSLGRISRWTGMSLDQTHRAFGALSILLLTLTIYGFIATAIRRPFYRRFALVLACFGGGFLWLSRIILRMTGVDLKPITAWLVEVNLFHAMLVYPHFVFAAALMTGSLVMYLKSERVRRYMPAAAAGCVATILAASHAFEAVAFIPIAGAYLVLDALGLGRMPGASRWKCCALVIGMPVGMLLVNRWMLILEPAWGDVVTRLSFQTPEPFRLILGLGASFAISVLTFEGFLRVDRPSGERMAKAWVLMVLVLAYVPYINWRWHLLNGIQIPLSILATQGLRRTVFLRIQRRRRALGKRRIVPRGIWAPAPQMAVMALVGIICCLSVANLFLHYKYQVQDMSSPTYLTRGELSAMDWMSRNVSLDSVVLGSYKTGNYVPRLSGQRVFLGEDMLTQAFEIRARDVGEFYSTHWNDTQREALLRHYQVGYVVYGPPERELGSYDPSASSFLHRIYEADGVEIFAVKQEGEGGMRTATLPEKEPLP
ncbi:MAG TPA: hypothetical protein VFW45_18360 [Candidatus Polarisedimenticolia bacterium]|nr:hypothetical protein [Candidatus Polarisedimenticolia bacterium]